MDIYNIGGLIKPKDFTISERRRSNGAVLVLSVLIMTFYIGQSLSDQISKILPHAVDLISFVLACLIAIFCIICLIAKTKRANFSLALIAYLLALCLCANLIIQSGGVNSPYLALLGLASLFVYPFGILAVLGLVIAMTLIFITSYNDIVSLSPLIMLIAYGPLCLIVSLIIWSSKTSPKTTEKAETISKPLADAKLKEFTNEAGAIINSIGDGMILIDTLGIIRLINPAAQSITGWSSQESIALNYKSVIRLINQDGKEIDDSSNPIVKVLNYNQQIRSSNFNLLTKNNKTISISLVVSPVAEASSGVIIVFHDITEEKKKEREQAEFISTASHEMRTPVASIEGYIGLAMNPQTAQIDIRARDYLSKAQLSSKHLGQLFQDLLDISKADDGRIKNNPSVINLTTFLQEIIQDFELKAKAKNIKLNFKPRESINGGRTIIPKYLVNLDPSHLREIFDNLIDNGIKYTNQNGEVSVDITGNSNQVVVAVKDNGIGIASEDIGHLFQKFYRIDNKDTREINGTGLGLYLCRRLTEIMGGNIWVNSSIGNGSSFFVQFPRLGEDQAEILTKQAASQPKLVDRSVSQRSVSDIIPKTPSLMIQNSNNKTSGMDNPQNLQTTYPKTISQTAASNQPKNQDRAKQPIINQIYRTSRDRSFNIPKR